MLPDESSLTPGIALLPRLRGPIPDRNNRFPTRFACGNAPTGSGARELWKVLSIGLRQKIYSSFLMKRLLQQRQMIPFPSFGEMVVQALWKNRCDQCNRQVIQPFSQL